MKGGVAKTTLAINLADCIARRYGLRVLLVDVDPQFNATQCLQNPEDYIQHLSQQRDTVLTVFDRASRPRAGTVVAPGVAVAKPLDQIALVNVKPNYSLLPGNLELYRLEMAPGDGRENRLKLYLEKVAAGGSVDVVLIDTPPTPSVWMTSALIASDYYLIPVKADPLSLTGIDLLQSVVEGRKENFSLGIQCAGVVLTITEENTTVFSKAKHWLETKPRWKGHLFKETLPKRIEIARNQGDQRFILDGSDPESKQAIVGITEELLKRIGVDIN